jgi:hypothetical protein
MNAYIARDLFTNLETFSTLIDFQKKCYGNYTPKAVFVVGLYILSITPERYTIIQIYFVLFRKHMYPCKVVSREINHSDGIKVFSERE